MPANSTHDADEPVSPPHGFPVVGIGASAGGIEALTQLVSALPSQPNLALVVVQHLNPVHESHLSDLLGHAARVPVIDVEDGQRIEAGHVYVIKPGTDVALTDGTLAVTHHTAHGPHYSIDHFFRSLAVVQGARSVGVVLSGTGTDGTLGLAEIRAAGGVTFAQDPETAKFGDMPRSAADSGVVDFVLPPARIAEQMVSIGERASDPSLADVEGPDDAFRRILGVLSAHTSVDFREYRDSTIKRRLARRMLLRGVSSAAEYAGFLAEHPEEVDALYRDVLINVTSFFRDADVFDVLAQSVFPAICDAKQKDEPIRVWVPGCSTGQEPYSLAMVLTEYLERRSERRAIQVFATDLGDQAIIDKARAGVYPGSIEADVNPERLRRFFTKEGQTYRVKKALRDLCVFARQNITVDPPFSRVDLISCRNVLIYMAPVLQRRVMPVFHFALNTPGFLVLGPAETVGDFKDLFDVHSAAAKIYIKKAAPPRPAIAFPGETTLTMLQQRGGRAGGVVRDVQKEADRLLLSRYAPPAVLLSHQFAVMQFFGRTSRFFEPPEGGPTTDVFRMARPGLFLDLRSALTEAQAKQVEVVRDLTIADAESEHPLRLRVLPMGDPGSSGPFYLVVFESPQEHMPAAVARGAAGLGGPGGPGGATEGDVIRLQQELAATREYLTALVDREESTNQELRSAHEEALSSNEELQSTNEELETAKEELQSSNEELTTVNEQLQQRNQQLDGITADMANFVASAGLPMVILGKDLTVRHLTPAARSVFHLEALDVGRPFVHIRTSLTIDNLGDVIAQVMATTTVWEQEVQDTTGRWWMLRVRPYHATSGAIDGVVILAVDIDQLRHTQAFKEARDHAMAIVQAVQVPLLVLTDARVIETANRAFRIKFGVASKDVEGHQLDEIRELDAAAIGLPPLLEAVAAGGPPLANHEITHDFPGIGRRTMILDGRAILNGAPSLVLLAIDDVTEQRAIEALRVEAQALRQMERRKDEFLGVLAHELRNPLAPILTALDVLRLSGDEHRAMAQAIAERQVRHLMRLVDDLLDVSRIAQGKVELRRERVRLSDIVNAAVEISRPPMNAAGQVLAISIPEEPVWLSADPIRLSQVLINLLNNASKFSAPAGHIWLIAETLRGDVPCTDARLSGENGCTAVRIRVRDAGIGMSADLVPRVFEMFVQGAQPLEDRRGGLGIGLTLVHRLVTLHGGTVEARSDGPGHGSEFVIVLPVEATAAASVAVSTAAPGFPTGLSGPPLRILLADDDADSREIFAVLLQSAGHTVIAVADGAAAIEQARATRPDVALLDLNMPKVNGYDVARQLRQSPETAGIALIAMSGVGLPGGRPAVETGFDAELRKPADVGALATVLARVRARKASAP